MGRIKFNELSVLRVYKAILRRFNAIPHKIYWETSELGKRNRKRLKTFKDLHEGERCFLVANGPSLKKMDLSFLNKEISFGLNRIYLGYDKYAFTNTYLVSINNLVLKQFHEELKKLDIVKFINWDARKLFKDRSDIYYIYKRFFGSSFGKEMHNSLTPAATVTYAALQIIYYMGFTEVIIIGMDHNFTSRSKIPNTKEIRTEKVDENHFHPDYFPKGSKWETPDLKSSEYFYSISRDVFEKDCRKIIDCTVGGKCTIFQKGDIKDYIKHRISR